MLVCINSCLLGYKMDKKKTSVTVITQKLIILGNNRNYNGESYQCGMVKGRKEE